jgi:uncharacterized protein YlxW (UPF0749 family)
MNNSNEKKEIDVTKIDVFELLPAVNEGDALKDRVLKKDIVREFKASFQDMITMKTHYQSEIRNLHKEIARCEKSIIDNQKKVDDWDSEIKQALAQVPELAALFDAEGNFIAQDEVAPDEEEVTTEDHE